jgi:hypothetical protein
MAMRRLLQSIVAAGGESDLLYVHGSLLKRSFCRIKLRPNHPGVPLAFLRDNVDDSAHYFMRSRVWMARIHENGSCPGQVHGRLLLACFRLAERG